MRSPRFLISAHSAPAISGDSETLVTMEYVSPAATRRDCKALRISSWSALDAGMYSLDFLCLLLVPDRSSPGDLRFLFADFSTKAAGTENTPGAVESTWVETSIRRAFVASLASASPCALPTSIGSKGTQLPRLQQNGIRNNLFLEYTEESTTLTRAPLAFV